MLTERQASILKAIVAEHVRTGQPAASKSLASKYRLSASPATVRKEMSELEEQGYLSQPHTSAGRVPTDRGYRWYVDALAGSGWPALSERDREAIKRTFEADFHGLDEALNVTSHVLAHLTEAVAVVAAPPAALNRLQRLELLRRDERRATLLLIADNGVVEQGLVEFDDDHREEDLQQVAAALNRQLAGVAFEDLAASVRDPAPGGASLHPVEAARRARIAAEVERLVSARTAERIFRDGLANILSPAGTLDIASAHLVVAALEEPELMSSLLDAGRRATDVLVLIGRENPIRQMRVCAVVFAPYAMGSSRLGALGVIGPTRMDYPRTITAVESIARSLSDALGQGA